ncbi:MAG: HD domain-containing phosphohydrolase [Planctomycetota bacterium]
MLRAERTTSLHREQPFKQEVEQHLAALRRRAESSSASLEVHGELDHLSNQLQRVLAEHAGMTREVLTVYEQLGIVFEVTRKLPSIQRDRDVVRLFLESLRNSFHGCTVDVAEKDEPGSWSLESETFPMTSWLSKQLTRAEKNHRVVVEIPPPVGKDSTAGAMMIGPVFAGDHFVCSMLLAQGQNAREFVASDMRLLEALTIFCGDLISNHRLVQELREMSLAMVRALVNAVDQKDKYTSGHSIRVAFYSTFLGKALGLSALDMQMLEWSALLHDVGKIGIRDDVLKKAAKLTDEEFDHIREHPGKSHEVVKQVPQLAKALDGVLYHHEHFDGSGYPNGLRGEDIPLQARIIQIADVFDALTSTRAYRKAFDWPAALAILEKESGSTVDPQLQKLFDRLIRACLQNSADAWPNLLRQANRFTGECGTAVATPGGD